VDRKGRGKLNIALHYDLRVQLDGTTTSWAIPRGLLGETAELSFYFELVSS
jgi:hypothetical protein